MTLHKPLYPIARAPSLEPGLSESDTVTVCHGQILAAATSNPQQRGLKGGPVRPGIAVGQGLTFAGVLTQLVTGLVQLCSCTEGGGGGGG